MKHDPNLFEAFKDASGQAAEARKAAKEPRDPLGGFGGGSGGGPARAPGSGLSLEPRALVLLAVLMAASFGAGWVLRGPGDAVRAEGPGGEPPRAGRDGGQASPGGSGAGQDGGSWLEGGGSGDWAPGSGSGASNSGPREVSAPTGLYNPANDYTVLAITYTDLPSLEARARNTAQYLRDQGLPAFDPIKNGDKIEVLVGAAPTRSELQTVLSKLQETRGPTGTSFDFRSALPVRIDSRVDRD